MGLEIAATTLYCFLLLILAMNRLIFFTDDNKDNERNDHLGVPYDISEKFFYIFFLLQRIR